MPVPMKPRSELASQREKNRSILDCAVCEDREITFDQPTKLIKIRAGEHIIQWLEEVEDIKGHNGTRGRVIVTNLRLLWYSHKHPTVNLAIGYFTIVSVGVRQSQSKLRGQMSALVIVAMFRKIRYEFIFGDLDPARQNLFSVLQSVCGAYSTSRLYRELRFRSNIARNKQLDLLPQEQIYERVTGTWNLSGDAGKLGTLYITNVRIVWIEQHNPNFNVTAPYIHILRINVRRKSKFGVLFILETTKCSGGYLLGFRIDPIEKMEEIVKEMRSLHKIYSTNPVLGIAYERVEDEDAKDIIIPPTIENTNVTLDYNDTRDIYLARGEDGTESRAPVFSPSLGLAIEPLIDGVSLASLWKINAVTNVVPVP